MYENPDFKDVEDVCYESAHVENVVSVIKKNFDGYFERFLETCAGSVPSTLDFYKLREKFNVSYSGKNVERKFSGNYKNLIISAIKDFESDREDYETILNKEFLEEYDDDPNAFKSQILKNKCPIIRKTLNSKNVEELKKYKMDFNQAAPKLLLTVVENICKFADEYKKNYNSSIYESAKSFEDLKMEVLDTESCTAYKVIGGGIKTQMLYKVYPGMFPYRSRDAIWAFWYLSGKETLDCEMSSEFLMIDTKNSVTRHNYFYPYRLFSWYAFVIYKFLKNEAVKYGVEIDVNYRYVIVDKFLQFVADEHRDEINFFKSQIKDGGVGYAYA